MSISTPLKTVIVRVGSVPPHLCVPTSCSGTYMYVCLNSVPMHLNSAASVSMLLLCCLSKDFTMTFLVLLLMMLLQMSLSMHSGRMKSITKDVCNVPCWKIAKDVCSTIDHIILKSWSHQVKKNLKKGTFVVVRKMSCSF